MRNAEWINLVYFSFFILVALILPHITTAKRIRAIAIGISGIVFVLAIPTLHGEFSEKIVSPIRDLVPAPLMVFAYWQAGSLFRAPNLKLQALLINFDRKLLKPFSFSWSGLNSYLEASYLFCYPLVPLGLAFLNFRSLAEHSDSYWTAILIPTYFCHAMVPFTQTFPPWMVEPENVKRNWNVTRAFNFWIIKYASIHANTLPSAHVAASMAAALVLMQFLPVAGFIFLLIALSISISAVAGRYHYSLDVISGAIVVLIVFVFLKL